MFSPLDVDGDLAMVPPVGAEALRCQRVQISVGVIVTSYPTQMTSSSVATAHGRNPGAMNVVLRREVMGDDRWRRVQDGNGAIQREPFIGLNV